MKLGKLSPKDSSWKPSCKALYAPEAKKSLSLSGSACEMENQQLICECFLARTVDLNSLSLIKVGNAIAQVIITDEPK